MGRRGHPICMPHPDITKLRDVAIPKLRVPCSIELMDFCARERLRLSGSFRCQLLMLQLSKYHMHLLSTACMVSVDRHDNCRHASAPLASTTAVLARQRPDLHVTNRDGTPFVGTAHCDTSRAVALPDKSSRCGSWYVSAVVHAPAPIIGHIVNDVRSPISACARPCSRRLFRTVVAIYLVHTLVRANLCLLESAVDMHVPPWTSASGCILEGQNAW